MFKGRIGVGQYWLGLILLLVLGIVAAGVLAGLYYVLFLPIFLESTGAGLGTTLALSLAGVFIPVIPLLIMLPYGIGLQIRRFHDMGLTGWVYLVLAIVSYGIGHLFPAIDPVTMQVAASGAIVSLLLFVANIVIMSWPGTKGPNKYGEPFRYRSLWAAIRGKKD
ncbi:MAG: hypothetical protein QOE22_383 [Candidatus Parcubacteria bacterium]|jgi:uncharacterized membrane protein YhaH (DUF805 family)|nr:hypothetical protein [Candidatus Parcubacteria bacterium]